MARGRMIDKRVSNSKKLGRITDKSARLYFMIYPHLDKKGRIAFDDLDDLMTEIIPYLKGWGLKKIRLSLNELADIELIQLYPDKNKVAMEFNRFEDFQTIRDDREAASRIIAPGVAPESSGVFRITPALSLSLSLINEGRKKKEKIFFNYEKKKFFNIELEDMVGWKDAYPLVNVDQQMKEMREWLLANPSKEKSNYKQFINNWLSNQQRKAGSKESYQDKRKKALDEWEKKPMEE